VQAAVAEPASFKSCFQWLQSVRGLIGAPVNEARVRRHRSACPCRHGRGHCVTQPCDGMTPRTAAGQGLARHDRRPTPQGKKGGAHWW
jgi:hypothetical protein